MKDEGTTTSRGAYRIENLDSYRKAVDIGTRVYQLMDRRGQAPLLETAVREKALALTLNVATGLGFWEKQWKAQHFRAAKKAALELIGLLDMLIPFGLHPDKVNPLSDELTDLAKEIGGLLRQAERKEDRL